jgi:hypothetical protein
MHSCTLASSGGSGDLFAAARSSGWVVEEGQPQASGIDGALPIRPVRATQLAWAVIDRYQRSCALPLRARVTYTACPVYPRHLPRHRLSTGVPLPGSP